MNSWTEQSPLPVHERKKKRQKKKLLFKVKNRIGFCRNGCLRFIERAGWTNDIGN